ncbi:IclR family transcriptional regulator [Nesterenkonia aerolata]|uniref:IclR family transcriptional regulator n=1 Tax=Nesterenkonia aerolata TaxID=3074079 RepID=A0ABU2DU84_9MICC|nr:IclR family transcriptional regulator [Nesterenkonia sp. LY-0111]MDR8019956.1 IclR family transcriptional regulator [Nesterenkonia sp. LY-0111]
MSSIAVVRRTFGVLEVVAASGTATAREIAERLEIPLPSVYRLLGDLVANNYVVHLRGNGVYELGPKCFDLGLAFRDQVTAPTAIRRAVDELHQRIEAAAYFAVYRGSDIILIHLSDCERHPRLQPLRFGFHEAAHATAFGKILLAGMEPEHRSSYLTARGMPRLTAHTTTDPAVLDEHLCEVSLRGIAWEHEEFLAHQTCAAVPVYDSRGLGVGAVAISMPAEQAAGRRRSIESTLRDYAGRCSRYLRSGGMPLS